MSTLQCSLIHVSVPRASAISALIQCATTGIIMPSQGTYFRSHGGRGYFSPGGLRLGPKFRDISPVVIVPSSPKAHDKERYLEKKLEMDTESDAMSDTLRADILRIIPQRISGMCVAESLVLISF